MLSHFFLTKALLVFARASGNVIGKLSGEIGNGAKWMGQRWILFNPLAMFKEAKETAMMEKKTCGRKTEDRDQEDHGEETLGLSRTEKSRIRLNTKTDKHDVQCTIPSCGKWKMIWKLKLRTSM